MKKTNIITLITILMLGLNISSQAQDNTAFDKGTVVVTAGIGLPNIYRTSARIAYNAFSSASVIGVGPLLLKGDYGIVKFKWGHSIGVGAIVGFNYTKVNLTYTSTRWNNGNNGWYTYNYNQTDKYTTISVGARGTYHFFTKEKLDCYASVGFGFNINAFSKTTNDPNGIAYSYNAPSSLFSSVGAGIRYYFTKNIGVYSELGWDMSAPIQAGLAIKF